MKPERELTLHPIGYVVTSQASPGEGAGWEDGEAELEIEPLWAEALDGIEEFSHIWILWWLDQSPDQRPGALKVHPEGRQEIPLVGLFATRSPRRPNPVAMTPVRLLERQGNRLRVAGVDAYPGTPILDIKPYLRRGDQIPDAVMPDWLEKLWRLHDQEQSH